MSSPPNFLGRAGNSPGATRRSSGRGRARPADHHLEVARERRRRPRQGWCAPDRRDHRTSTYQFAPSRRPWRQHRTPCRCLRHRLLPGNCRRHRHGPSSSEVDGALIDNCPVPARRIGGGGPTGCAPSAPPGSGPRRRRLAPVDQRRPARKRRSPIRRAGAECQLIDTLGPAVVDSGEAWRRRRNAPALASCGRRPPRTVLSRKAPAEAMPARRVTTFTFTDEWLR